MSTRRKRSSGDPPKRPGNSRPQTKHTTRGHSHMTAQTSSVRTHRHNDDGTIVVAFNAASTVGQLAGALAGLPQDAGLHELAVMYFSGDEACNGQPIPDEDHWLYIANILVHPQDEPEDATVTPIRSA